MAFELTPAREKELEKIAKDLPDSSFKKLYGKDWKSVKIATAMNILKKKLGFKEEKTKMKFTEIRDIVEKMSGSKLTGQEVSTWYRKNPDVKKAAQKDKKVKQAVEIALDHGGAMNFAIKKIEKMKRGLADHPAVAKALSFANFGEEKTLEDGAGENSAAAQYAKDTPGQTPIGEETLTEGTWAVPDSYPKLVKLQNFLSKPHKAKTARDVHKFHIDADMYFGDDSFSDDLDAYKSTLPGGEVDQYDKKEKYPKDYMDRMKKYNKIKPGTDLNLVLMKALSDWTGGVLKFKGNKIVQMPREWYMKDNPENKKDNSPVKAKLESEVKEKLSKKRPRGNIKMKRMEPIKVESLEESVKKTDPLDRAERILSYKLKELQYKSELRRFNEFEESKVSQYRMEANNAPLAKRALKRFKGADAKLAQRIANAVKPGRVIQSKLYVELGDLWDKKDMKGFEKHLKKNEK